MTVDIRKHIEQSNDVPTLPVIAMKAMEIMNDENSSINDLSDLITKDASLTVKILKIVNSSIYSFDREVTNLSRALSVLGLNAIGNIVLSVSAVNVLKGSENNYDFSKFLENSLFKAVTAKLIAQKIGYANIEEIFISGLLTDISFLFLVQNFKEDYMMLSFSNSPIKEMLIKEIELFGLNHAEISSLILEKSNVPDILRLPVKYHHNLEGISEVTDVAVKRAVKIVYCATKITELFYGRTNNIVTSKNEISDLLDLEGVAFEQFLSSISDKVVETSEFFEFKDTAFPTYFEILEKANNQLVYLNIKYENILKELQIEQRKSNKFREKLQETNKKLLNLALKDPLTGAYNRRYINEILDGEIARVKRSGGHLVVLMCDIDHFKHVNDTYGHDNGDIVLKKVVNILKETLRKNDILARVGGEEFVVVCQSTNTDDGVFVAEKLRKAIEEATFSLTSGNDIGITMSFGVACYNTELKNVQNLLKLADNRLYDAKNTGRNKVIYK